LSTLVVNWPAKGIEKKQGNGKKKATPAASSGSANNWGGGEYGLWVIKMSRVGRGLGRD